jgi:integral membrane protein (TIGR01906 family)
MAADPPTPPPDSSEKRSAPGFPRWLALVCRALIVLALPPFLVLTGVRLVMSETFLRLEYNRPGFPPDRYGFTQAERLEYAPFAVRYLLQNEDVSYLARLEHQGAPLFTERELRHMQDVQDVTRVAFRVHWATVVVLLAAALALAWRPETRTALRQGVQSGGVLTIALMLTAIVLVVANWDFFFTGFHRIFFEGDSWLFSTRATLIRLFPERFWFDAAIAIGAITFAGAVIAILAGTLSGRAARSAA